MRAVRLFSPGDVRCVQTPVPRISAPDDVLIRVRSCGVCGSDVPRVMVKGAYRHPITIGHEFAGEVVEVGAAVTGVHPGDRVTVMPLTPCGTCPSCRVGNYTLCTDYDYYGSRSDGAMAELVTVKAANVLAVPGPVDFESASMTDPASVALHAVRRHHLLPGQTAAVLGTGPIGLFAVQWLRLAGCRSIIAVDLFDEKLALARELGAEHCINARLETVPDAIRDRTGGQGADFVVELAGSSVTQLQAVQSAARRATVVFCGLSYDDLTLPAQDLNRILRFELTIFGSWNSSIAPLPINEWKTSLEYMSRGFLTTKSLITHRFRLEECGPCFDMLSRREKPFTKVLFIP